MNKENEIIIKKINKIEDAILFLSKIIDDIKKTTDDIKKTTDDIKKENYEIKKNLYSSPKINDIINYLKNSNKDKHYVNDLRSKFKILSNTLYFNRFIKLINNDFIFIRGISRCPSIIIKSDPIKKQAFYYFMNTPRNSPIKINLKDKNIELKIRKEIVSIFNDRIIWNGYDYFNIKKKF